MPGGTPGTVPPPPPAAKISPLAISRAPSVRESQQSLWTSLDGGKKFRPTTILPDAGLAATSGWPLLHCATNSAPAGTLVGSSCKLLPPPSYDETLSRKV